MQNDQVSNIAAAAIFIAVENQSPKNSYAAPSQPNSTCDSIGSNAANQALLREMATIAEDLQKGASPQDLDDFSDLAGELQTGNNNSIFSPASNSYNNNNNNGGTGHWNGDRTNDVSNLLKQIANGSGNGQMAEEKLALKLLRDAMNGGSSDVQSQLRDLLNMAGGQGNSNSGGYGNNGGYGNYNNNGGGNGNYNNNLGLFNNNNNGYGNNGYSNNNGNGGYGNYNNNLGIFNNGNNNGYGNNGYGNYNNNNNNGGYGNYNNNLGNFGGNQGVNYGSTEGDGPDGSDGSCDNNNNGSNIGDNAFSNLLQQLGSVCGNMSNSGSNNGQLGQLLNNLVNGSNSGYNNNNNYGSQLSNLNQGLSDQSNILNSARYGNHNNNGGNYGQDHSNLDDMLRSLAQNDCGPNQGGSGAYEGNNGFDFKSWGDPHIETNLDGKTKSADRMQDNPNFNTVYNTNGGQTRVGTTETPEKNGVTFNDQVNIHHSGRDEWHVNSDHQDDGTVKTTVSDKYGDHVLKDGDSVMEGDGSKISQADGKVVVSQKTSGGGSVDTTITNNGQGLDVDEKGAGHVVMDGQAVRQATKS